MARMPRVVGVGAPHHITQRGNQRRDVFTDDQKRTLYLELLKEHATKNGLRLLAWCLMTNHVHVVAVPERAKALAGTFRHAHGRFAQCWNTLERRVGHMWQNRFYSCAVEPHEAWRVIRYVELNPVRAGMVERAGDYAWSSARVHLGFEDAAGRVDLSEWRWTAEEWAKVLGEGGDADCETIRQATYTGRPWGSAEFAERLEKELGWVLVAQKGGRPKKVVEVVQGELWG